MDVLGLPWWCSRVGNDQRKGVVEVGPDLVEEEWSYEGREHMQNQ